MRIDLPTCGFKSCRYCFDGNCTKRIEYDRCEYREYKKLFTSAWTLDRIPNSTHYMLFKL